MISRTKRALVKTLAKTIAMASLSATLALPSTDKPSRTELAEITARGRLLAQYDEAAWHSTDAVRALEPAQGTVERYIAKKTDAGWKVAYGRFNEKQDRFLVVYEATQSSNAPQFAVHKLDPPQEDIGFYTLGAKAIQTALRDFQGEKRPYNMMVLPVDSGQMYVYIVPAQTTEGVYPLGGDVRYLISPDGNSIVQKRQLHKTIIEVKISPKPGQTLAGFHTHVLSDVPEDTDVFYVLVRRPLVPEYVGITKTLIYVIETDGTIIRVAK